MGAIHTEVVQYTWTTRDHLIAQAWPKHFIEGATREDRYVTPYRILPSTLPDCKKWKVGDSVAIALEKSSERWAVDQFFVDGCEWVEVPAAVAVSGTLSDLCAKLLAHNPHRFPAAYYDFSKKTAKTKSEVSRLLFEYWKNSPYRHASIQAGFDWSNPRYPDKQVLQDGQKLRWVLGKKPVVVKVPVAPGSQTMQMEDPTLDALSGDIVEMRLKAARIVDLLRTSEVIMRGRLSLSQRFTALHTLIDVCANAHPEANPDAIALSGTSKALGKKVLDSLRNKPLAELLDESNASPSVMHSLRKSFGFSDDIAAEIRRIGLELVEKLTSDADFAARCGSWATLALKKGLAGTPAFQLRYNKLVVALVEVLAALQEVHTADEFADKLLTILERVPSAPVTDGNAIERIGQRSALDVVLALGGPTISMATTSVGNAAGPPSLYIAVVQLRAAKKIADAMRASSSAAAVVLRDELLAQLRSALGQKTVLADKLAEAIKKNDQEALLRMKTEVLDEVTTKTQSSGPWKGGIVLLQIVAMAMAMAAVQQKATVEFADMLGLVGSGTTIIVPLVDLGITVAGKQASAALAKVGMGLGAFSAFMGVIVAVMQLAEADRSNDKLALFAAGTSLLGNFCLMVGSFAWYGVAIPGLNVAGLVLIVTSTAISVAAIAADELTPMTRKVARSLIGSIKSHPMYDLLRDEPEFRRLMTTLEEKIEAVFLPQPQNNTFVVDRLRAAGFRSWEVNAMVEQTGAPLSPMQGLTTAH